MQLTKRWPLAAAAAVGLLLAGCGEADESTPGSGHNPATVEEVAGSDLSRITLEERAVERLDLQTVPVREVTVQTADGEATRLAVPYGAIIYDPDGGTWVYTSPEPRSFVRAPITVDRIDGDVAVLSEGPDVGTLVVSVAAVELYGAELGVDH